MPQRSEEKKGIVGGDRRDYGKGINEGKRRDYEKRKRENKIVRRRAEQKRRAGLGEKS